MASTTSFELTNDAWTLIAEGQANVALQLSDQGKILVHIGENTVSPDDSTPGLLIANTFEKIPSDFSASGLPETANVWCKSADASDNVGVVVIAY